MLFQIFISLLCFVASYVSTNVVFSLIFHGKRYYTIFKNLKTLKTLQWNYIILNGNSNLRAYYKNNKPAFNYHSSKKSNVSLPSYILLYKGKKSYVIIFKKYMILECIIFLLVKRWILKNISNFNITEHYYCVDKEQIVKGFNIENSLNFSETYGEETSFRILCN